MPFAYPDNDLSYAGNFLNMMFKGTETKYKLNPVLERALDVLFILHADHEQELLDHHHARHRLVALRPLHRACGSRGGALRPAPRRGQRGRGCAC